MNLHAVEPETPAETAGGDGPEMGTFTMMFELQKALQLRIHGDALPAFTPERLPMDVCSIVAELGEILEAVQHWKDWKQNPADYDVDHLRMEYVDLLHFVVNLGLHLGFDAPEIRQEFIRKNQTNHQRQDGGY